MKYINFDSGRSFRVAVRVFIFAVPALYVGSCSYVGVYYNNAFNDLDMGSTASEVLMRMGSPAHIEKSGEIYSRYASEACVSPCAKRIWFENKLSMDTEAWSVEFDSEQRLIKKTRWVSP